MCIRDRMDLSEDRATTGIEITARLIREIKDMCDGTHIMAIGWESKIPLIVERAGLANSE